MKIENKTEESKKREDSEKVFIPSFRDYYQWGKKAPVKKQDSKIKPKKVIPPTDD